MQDTRLTLRSSVISHPADLQPLILQPQLPTFGRWLCVSSRHVSFQREISQKPGGGCVLHVYRCCRLRLRAVSPLAQRHTAHWTPTGRGLSNASTPLSTISLPPTKKSRGRGGDQGAVITGPDPGTMTFSLTAGEEGHTVMLIYC